MKVSLFLCLLLALCFFTADAQRFRGRFRGGRFRGGFRGGFFPGIIPPIIGFPPIIPPILPLIPPIGIPPVPGVGIPPVPGVGIPPVPGVGIPPVPGVGVPPLGKRSLENTEAMNLTETSCIMSTLSNKLTCNGKLHNFECKIKNFVMIENLNMEEENDRLRIVSDSLEDNESRRASILSINMNTTLLNDFSLKSDDGKEVLLSIFHDEKILDDGFRVTDLDCWKQFIEMIDHDSQANLKFEM